MISSKEPQSISDVVNEFRYKSAPLVAQGDRHGVKKLFSKMLTDLRLSNRDEQLAAKSAMRKALRDVMLEPSRQVKRDWFEDL